MCVCECVRLGNHAADANTYKLAETDVCLWAQYACERPPACKGSRAAAARKHLRTAASRTCTRVRSEFEVWLLEFTIRNAQLILSGRIYGGRIEHLLKGRRRLRHSLLHPLRGRRHSPLRDLPHISTRCHTSGWMTSHEHLTSLTNALFCLKKKNNSTNNNNI